MPLLIRRLTRKPWFDEPQPWRTDWERLLSGVDFLDVEIDG